MKIDKFSIKVAYISFIIYDDMDCHICRIMSIATTATYLTQFVPYFYIELRVVITIRKCNCMSSCKTPIVFMMFLHRIIFNTYNWLCNFFITNGAKKWHWWGNTHFQKESSSERTTLNLFNHMHNHFLIVYKINM